MSTPNAASVSQPQQVQLPPQAMPQPLPAAFGVSLTDGAAGQRMVVLTIFDATGQRIVFLDAETAQSIGGQIRQAGKQAMSALLTPASGLVLPGQP